MGLLSLPFHVAGVVIVLVGAAIARFAGAQAPAASPADTPAAWLAKAEKAAAPNVFLVHEHVAALMARMGKPAEALDYLDRATKTRPERTGSYDYALPGLLLDAHDGPACVAMVKAMAARNRELINSARELVSRMISDGLFDDAGALIDVIEQPPPPAPGVRDDRRRRAGDIADMRHLLDRARTALADSPAPTPLGKTGPQEYDYACAAVALARGGQVDRALAMIAKRGSREPRGKVMPLTRVLTALLDQDKFDRAKVAAVLQVLEPQLGTDVDRARLDSDETRLAVATARVRMGDRQPFQKHLDLFRARHAADDINGNSAGLRGLSVEVAGRLQFNDLAGAKAVLENVELTSSSDPRLAFALPARAVAAAGKLDDFRPWIDLLNAPEFRADSYAHACVGVAEGLWERERRGAASGGAAPAAKSP